jgi:hypothetical protein
MNLTPPFTLSELKTALRLSPRGLSATSRLQWWPTIVAMAPGQYELQREQPDDAVETSAGLLALYGNPPCTCIEHVLELLSTTKKIDPLYFNSPARIISNAIKDYKVCYLICCNIINYNSLKPDMYIPLTIENNLERVCVFKELLKSYMPKTYDALDSIKALELRYLDLIFKDFFSNLLPEHIICRIMDSFLLEGQKVIYRYGLALIMLYKQQIKSGSFKTGAEVWDNIMKDALSLGGEDRYSRLSAFAFEIGRNVIMKLMRPIGIGREKLNDFRSTVRRNKYPEALLSQNSEYLLALGSSEGESSKESQKLSPQKYLDLDRSSESYKYFMNEKRSKILNQSDDMIGFLLHNCLPKSYHHSYFELSFSTTEYGFGLSQLFRAIEGRSPCLVLIKATLPGYVVGFFVDCSLSPPSAEVRGNGNTVVFRLDSQEPQVHKWCGLSSAAGDDNSMPLKQISTSQPMKEAIVRNFFVLSSKTHIAVGSSFSRSENAISFNEDLRYCYLGASDTFGMKDALVCGRHGLQTNFFEIGQLEVYCLKHSKKHSD